MVGFWRQDFGAVRGELDRQEEQCRRSYAGKMP